MSPPSGWGGSGTGGSSPQAPSPDRPPLRPLTSFDLQPPRLVGHNPPHAWRAIYTLMLRNLAKRGRMIGLAVLGVGGAGVGLALRLAGPIDPVKVGTKFISGFGLSVLVPVACLVFASAAVGDATDDATLVYLWLRPVHRSKIILAAFAAALTICVPLVGLPLIGTAALVGGSAELVSGTAVSVIVSVVAYCGIFTAWGVRIRRALPWGLAYILLWEGFAATAGVMASRLAIRSYSQSIMSEYTGVALRLASFSLGLSIIVPLVVTAVALTYATRRVRVQDVA